MSIQSLIAGLTGAEVAFVVVGGVAGAVHGSPFTTNDLDVCYATDRDNLSRLARVLKAWAAYPRGREDHLPFTMDARALRATPTMTLRSREGDLDLLDAVQGVGTYADALASSEEVVAAGIRFRVLTLDALLRARRASARPKDLAQLATLDALAAIKHSQVDR